MTNIFLFILLVSLASMFEAIIDAARSYPNSKFWSLLPNLPLNTTGAHVFKVDWLHLSKYPMVICYVVAGLLITDYLQILLIPVIRLVFFDVFLTKVIKKWQ
jgi:hypothetical protein